MIVLAIAALTAAHLFVVSVRAVGLARSETMAVVLAAQKMEQLRSLTWRFDGTGSLQSLSDHSTDLTREPSPGGGPGLGPSPAGSLWTNTTGYVDYVDRHGRWVGTGSTPPSSAAFVRRWNVMPLPASPGDSLILRVLVTTVARDALFPITALSRVPGDVTLVSVITRKAA